MKTQNKNSNWGGRRPGAGRKAAQKDKPELVVLYTRVLERTKEKLTDMATDQNCSVGKILDDLTADL